MPGPSEPPSEPQTTWENIARRWRWMLRARASSWTFVERREVRATVAQRLCLVFLQFDLGHRVGLDRHHPTTSWSLAVLAGVCHGRST